ncbi:MAG: leucine-rich repeat protein, partial [Neisseriaceae bacterium]|nr:leucine-rich repeat protein [Neisseriaceae bacterium]
NCIAKIGENAFIASENLTSVTIKSEARCDNAGLYLRKGGIRYKVLNKNEVMVDTKEYESPFFNSNPQKYSGDIVIPSKVIAGNTFSVVAINDAAFAESIDLKSVTIPNAVKTIGRDAFRNCIHLTAIYCQAKSEPMGWDVYWNPNKYKVVWGAIDKFK